MKLNVPFDRLLRTTAPQPLARWSYCTEADENMVRRLALVLESTRNRPYSPYG